MIVWAHIGIFSNLHNVSASLLNPGGIVIKTYSFNTLLGNAFLMSSCWKGQSRLAASDKSALIIFGFASSSKFYV